MANYKSLKPSISIKPSKTMGRRSNFALVAGGRCPHDGGALGDEVPTKGFGVTRRCGVCDHVWYLNRKIHTCKCETCTKSKHALASHGVFSYNRNVAELCSGSTGDFGSLSPGSNPGSAATSVIT